MKIHVFSNYHENPSAGVAPADKQFKLESIEGLRKKNDFIEMARFYSETYGIDADAYRDGDQLELHFYFNFRRFERFTKIWLQTLISAGAVMEIPAQKNRPCEIEFVLYWN